MLLLTPVAAFTSIPWWLFLFYAQFMMLVMGCAAHGICVYWPDHWFSHFGHSRGHFLRWGLTLRCNCYTWSLIDHTWWYHRMETFSALLALCSGNSPVTSEFPSERPVTRSFDDFFDLGVNKQLSKQSWGCWFETPSRSLWCHCNEVSGLW